MGKKPTRRDFSKNKFKPMENDPKLMELMTKFDKERERRVNHTKIKLDALKVRLDAPPLDLRSKFPRLPKPNGSPK